MNDEKDLIEKDIGPELKKELSLFDLILIGLGCIVGSGVFVILGRTIFIGGRYVVLGFILVTIISIIMGYVYIEIYSRYKSEITEYLAVKNTLGEKMGKFTLYVVYFFAIFSSITVIVSITKYIGVFKGKYLKEIVFSIFLLIVIMMINLAGIRTSKIVCNCIGISLIIILGGIGLLGFNKINLNKIFNGPQVPWSSFVLATILAFFLFNGYDVLVKMSGEVKDEKDTKKALITSLSITSVFYIMIIIVLISVMGYSQIGKTYYPLSKIYEYLINKNVSNIVYLIGCVILFNTAFLTLTGGSRFLYGLSNNKVIPYSEHLTQLNRNQAPQNAILVTFVISVIAALLNNEVILAVITNFSAMYIMITISICLIMIRWRERDNKKEQKEHNYIKGNINNIPIPVVISLCILIYFMIVILKNKFWIGNKLI